MKNGITDKWITAMERYDDRYIECSEPELPEPGKLYFVYTREYVGPNRNIERQQTVKWSTNRTLLTDGMGGNSNQHIKRFHGWRGTTDDWAIYAHGVRKCTNVIRREFAKTVHYRIEFGADEAAGRD